jgi:uncharacterized protein YxeA
MKGDLLKVIGIVVAIVVAAFIFAKAFIDGKKIDAQTKLMALKLDHDHKERMADKLIEYHRQAYGNSRSFFYHENFKPSA